MKRESKRSWWVQCIECEQWYHIRCVNITKKEAEEHDFTCLKCTEV